MQFTSPIFLFFFLPLALATVSLIRGGSKAMALLFWSAFFYFWGEPKFFFVAVLSALCDYLLCQRIYLRVSKPEASRYLFAGVGLNLGILFYFKYMEFFLGGLNISIPHVALPIGVSFIVFEKITYLVDVYRGKNQPAANFRTYLLYVLLFPKLLAGPIVKYHDIADQLGEKRQSLLLFKLGFERFLLGLVKKVFIADTLGELVDTVFALPLPDVSFKVAWLGIFAFSTQIYFDFSAYSDMAIGMARMFGFQLRENFNMPYTATSFTDFWRRWHISLSTWIKEYLYISLGGNRYGVTRAYVNLCICFLLSGLWHGANWTFVLWGAYNGLFLVLDKLFWLRLSARLPRLLNIALTFFFVMFGWVIFRSASLAQLEAFFSAMMNPLKLGQELYITANIWTALVISGLLSFIPALGIYEKLVEWWNGMAWRGAIHSLCLSSFSLLALAKAITVTFKPFLYFRF